jgi:hypothetical protein
LNFQNSSWDRDHRTSLIKLLITFNTADGQRRREQRCRTLQEDDGEKGTWPFRCLKATRISGQVFDDDGKIRRRLPTFGGFALGVCYLRLSLSKQFSRMPGWRWFFVRCLSPVAFDLSAEILA